MVKVGVKIMLKSFAKCRKFVSHCIVTLGRSLLPEPGF